ncbi:MAG: hypothetical protein WCG21_11385 [Eubacteriales bacterium]
MFSVVVNLLSGLVKENWFIWTVILGVCGLIFGALLQAPQAAFAEGRRNLYNACTRFPLVQPRSHM